MELYRPPAQKVVVTDVLLSLSPAPQGPPAPAPSVAQWWGSINRLYLSKAAPVGKNGARGGAAAGNARVVLAGQVSDEACSLGKSLKLSQLPALAAAARPAQAGGLALVLTARNLAVEGFCASRCGHHGSYGGGGAGSSTRAAYAWVGNPADQWPGSARGRSSVAGMVAGAVTSSSDEPRKKKSPENDRWDPPSSSSRC